MSHNFRSLMLVFGAAFLTTPPAGATADDYTVTGKVSGDAYGVSVKLRALLGLVGLQVGPIPHVVLPSSGGLAADTLLGLSLPGIINSQTLPVLTAGTTGPIKAGSASVAAVEGLNLLNGLIRADVIAAVCSSQGDGVTASSDTSGSVLANLVIGGVAIPAAPKPNTKIPLFDGLLKLGDVILNEQVSQGDGIKTSAVDVNMLHVKLVNPILLNGQLLKGDIIVSSAHCGVDASRVPGTPGGEASITGAGTIGTGSEELATFALDARQGETELQYADYGANLTIQSAESTSFTISGNCAQLSGPAEVNAVAGYTYEISACDNGDPGVESDSFSITATGPDGFYYTRSGTLTGGNLLLND